VKAAAAVAAAVVASFVIGGATAAAKPKVPRWGEQIGTIRISKIGLYQPIMQGDRPSVFYNTAAFAPSLDKGPAHYPGTPFPWQSGTSMFAGHRVTHTHPFLHTNELSRGDRIVLATTHWGKFHFRVLRVIKTKGPWAPEWHAKHGLLLSACDPPGQAWRRLIVEAKLYWMRLPGQSPTTVQG
jgi:sortase A